MVLPEILQDLLEPINLTLGLLDMLLELPVHFRIVFGAFKLRLHDGEHLVFHRVRIAQTGDEDVACFVLSHVSRLIFAAPTTKLP